MNTAILCLFVFFVFFSLIEEYNFVTDIHTVLCSHLNRLAITIGAVVLVYMYYHLSRGIKFKH